MTSHAQRGRPPRRCIALGAVASCSGPQPAIPLWRALCRTRAPSATRARCAPRRRSRVVAPFGFSLWAEAQTRLLRTLRRNERWPR
jgi:hypothetical protein